MMNRLGLPVGDSKFYAQFTVDLAQQGYKSVRGARKLGFTMLSIIIGVILIVTTSVGFWYLLPRDGVVHPLVNKWDGGSMITLIVMTGFTFGVVIILTTGFFG